MYSVAACLAGGGFEPVERVGHLGGLPAQGQDPGLHGACHREVEQRSRSPRGGGDLAASVERLLELAALDERARACSP